MEISEKSVGILQCSEYSREQMKTAIETICQALNFTVQFGAKVLLKPNLISKYRKDGLACTHPEFIAVVAEWFIDNSAVVLVGDSPAFGSARSVMKACHITDALKGLPVELVDFNSSQSIMLASGIPVELASEPLECDILVNLPKVKAHSQLLVTLALKNYFGTVIGMTKPWWHLRYGGNEDRFAALLIDLLDVLPNGITLVDGVSAMHASGPLNGKHYPLGVIAGSVNPVALEYSLLNVLGIDEKESLLFRECIRRNMNGISIDQVEFPLLSPDMIKVERFKLPERLKPVSFNPCRVAVGGVKRILAGMGGR